MRMPLDETVLQLCAYRAALREAEESTRREFCEFCPCAGCTKGELLAEAESSRAGESAALEEVARLSRLNAILETDRDLHPYGRCACQGEGSCGWCERSRAIEILPEAVAELEAARAEADRLRARVADLEAEVEAWRDDSVERLERRAMTRKPAKP